MKSHPPVRTAVAALLTALLACTQQLPTPVEPKADVCPTVGGEFQPTDCALVRGVVRDSNGALRSGLAVKVDSAVIPGTYRYASASATTGSDGHFELTVARFFRAQPVTTPDTTRVEIKSYPGPDPVAHDVPNGRVAVTMYFAELGKPVKPTIVDVVFKPYPQTP